MAQKLKNLQQWCKLRCDGYRDVEITNMTSSWKSGLAFCAIIHRYRPDLIDYDSLRKEDTFGNCKLAFDVAKEKLGIAALLDPEDMVIMTVPDKLCIVTYVAQYYNYFHDKQQLGGPAVKSAVKRPSHMIDVFPSPEPKKTLTEITNVPTTVPPSDSRVSPAAKRRTIDDRCCMCHEKVYLLERHYAAGKLYHRRCCREAERATTLIRNKEKENVGNSGDKPGSTTTSGQPQRNDFAKNRSIFGLEPVAAKVDPPTGPSAKPPSTGLMKHLYVPSNYTSGASGTSPEVSNVPKSTNTVSSTTFKLQPSSGGPSSNSGQYQTNNTVTVNSSYTPKTVALASSEAVAKTSVAVKVAPSSTRSSFFGKKSTSGSVSSNPTTPKYSTPAAKTPTSSGGGLFSNFFSNKSSPSPAKEPGSLGTTKVTTTTSKSNAVTTTVSVTSGQSSSKYTGGIFGKQNLSTGQAVTTVSPAVTTTGYTSTVTATISGAPSTRPGAKATEHSNVPTFQLGSGDITFTFKHDDAKVTPLSTENKRMPTYDIGVNKAGDRSHSTSKGTTFVTQVNKDVKTPTSPASKGGDGVGKTEWQIEAEKRALARNGTYVDPEKNPRGAATGWKPSSDVSPVGSKQVDFSKKDTSPMPKTDESKSNAAANLVQILNKQLHPKRDAGNLPNRTEVNIQINVDDRKIPSAQKVDDSWVVVEHSEADDETRRGMNRNPAFRIADQDVPSDGSPVSPSPAKFRQIVREGTFGFKDKVRPSEVPLPKFDSTPPTVPKQAHNPRVPKRKVNAEEKVSMEKINKQLVSLDKQLRVIEAKGCELEDKIRGGTDEIMDEEENEAMIDWFNLVKQKYELVREESDLMYRRRQQELEELHEELEYQFRCLSVKPDEEKTFDEKNYEADLLKDILEIVRLRDSIVNSIEVDRKRYLEEDQTIESMMQASGANSSGKKKRKNKKNKKKNYQFAEKEKEQKEGGEKRVSWFKKSPKNT